MSYLCLVSLAICYIHIANTGSILRIVFCFFLLFFLSWSYLDRVCVLRLCIFFIRYLEYVADNTLIHTTITTFHKLNRRSSLKCDSEVCDSQLWTAAHSMAQPSHIPQMLQPMNVSMGLAEDSMIFESLSRAFFFVKTKNNGVKKSFS